MFIYGRTKGQEKPRRESELESFVFADTKRNNGGTIALAQSGQIDQ